MISILVQMDQKHYFMFCKNVEERSKPVAEAKTERKEKTPPLIEAKKEVPKTELEKKEISKPEPEEKVTQIAVRIKFSAVNFFVS